ncbi:hypothetical protein [Haloarcula pellucida]|uniref:Uncharacterized protein n=1 Tax=Haloarcula pellucida TaxID=1427151 RepID=A0A830GNB4_9EURY|nr:hypothetical protein [Halomicroarcula pellucida]MBX0348232.1 hypothetical protein [Halomicroarcula pellucida]GGN97610.1 hypothetical protein GCM10009030_27010 [Halomicroarcula pellucida]
MAEGDILVGLITAVALIQGASSILLNSLVAEIRKLYDSEANHLYRIYGAISVSYLLSLIGLIAFGWGVLAVVKILDFGISGQGEPLPPLSLDAYSFIGTIFLFSGIILTWLAVIYSSGIIAYEKKKSS